MLASSHGVRKRLVEALRGDVAPTLVLPILWMTVIHQILHCRLNSAWTSLFGQMMGAASAMQCSLNPKWNSGPVMSCF